MKMINKPNDEQVKQHEDKRFRNCNSESW